MNDDGKSPSRIDGSNSLLQSHLGEIHLLPALPSKWPRGSVRGLVARGAHVVDLEWDEGRLVRARVKVSMGEAPVIRVAGTRIDPDGDPRVTVEAQGR